MIRRTVLMMMAVGLCLTVPVAGADVFSMPGALISVEFVAVENAGNAADSATSYGAVDYNYNMGKYEVTAGQYTEFLNAVAATDTHLLYNSYMSGPGYYVGDYSGCEIVQSGSPGSYTYSVTADRANRPVNYVGWGDAARFTNWLHNGQPTGLQDATTTETGAYALNGAVTDPALLAVTREENARYMLPTEDEWYKAAYHKNDGVTGNYFAYPTSSDRYPVNPTYTAVWDWNAGDSDAEYGPYNAASFIGQNYYPDGRDGNGYWQSEVDFWDKSESPYNTLGQAGNASEWTEGTGFTSIPVAAGRITRGGGRDDGRQDLKSDARDVVTPWDPADEDEDPYWDWQTQPIYLGSVDYRQIGFRVAEEFIRFAPGDFDGINGVNDIDIDMLCDFIRGGLPYDSLYDVSGAGEGVADGFVDTLDLDYLVHALVETAIGNGTEYGDFNLDGMVDTTDLTRLATNYGADDWGWDDGNANRYIDTDIDNTDLTILATYYGFVATPDAIPEPATLSLLALGGLALFRRKRR